MSQRNRMGQEAPIRRLTALLTAVSALLLLGAGAVSAKERAPVGVSGVERVEGGVSFDLALAEGLAPGQAAELDQGEAVSVTWELELVRDRKLWFNTTVGRLEVKATAIYDPLTKRYSLERHAGKELLAAAEAGQRAEALEWLTRLDGALVPAPDKAFEKPRLRWRARAILDRKLVMLFVPTTVKTEWDRGELASGAPAGGDS